MTLLLQDLEREYYTTEPLLHRFCVTLQEQLEKLLRDNHILLGVPVEHRIKSWQSISEKLHRKTLALRQIIDLNDLAGLRLLLLFKRDVHKTCDLLSQTFTVIKKEET